MIKVINKENMPRITLPPEQQSQFEMVLKRGMLKQLHHEKMLTDEQLSQALSFIKRQKHEPI